MPDVKVGDEVCVYERRRPKDSKMPPEGWPGHVVKIGRRYATAEYVCIVSYYGGDSHEERRVIEFDMEDGWERGSVSNYATTVKTRAMAERDARRDAAMAVLKGAGIEFRPGRERKFTLEQIEALAEVAKTFGEG